MRISTSWSDTKGEARALHITGFEGRSWIERADFLQDCLHMITNEYNKVVKENTK